MLERWTRAVVRRRLAVLAAWAAVAVLGAAAWTALPGRLTSSFAVPGSDSERAAAILAERFGERPEGTFVVVFRARGVTPALERRLAAAARAVPEGRAGRLRADGGVVWGEVATPLELSEAKRHTERLRAALAGRPEALVTGQPAIQHDLDPVLAADLRRGEAVALPAALLVLVALFGLSAAVAIPFVFAACTIAGALAGVWALAAAMPTATYVVNLVALLGVGLAVDYSLLVVDRFREELARGAPVEDAVVRTTATAGLAVVFSGLAVAVGLGLLLVVPVPLIRSLGLGGLLVPVVSVAGALTLQPALLAALGPRVGRARARRTPLELGAWARLARAVTRRPALVLAAAAVPLLVLAAPALALRVEPGSFAGLPASMESARGLALLREAVGPGAITPTQIVVDRAREARPAVNRLADLLVGDPETLVVASGRRPPYVDESGRFARVVVVGRHDYGSPQAQAAVERLRARHVPAAGFPAGTTVVAGGAPAQGADFLHAAYAAFPWLVLAALAVTYLVLARAFRSLVLPLEAVALNLLSVAAVYGLLVLIFGRDVEGWIPILLFAMLFGLSMDYEVFLVSRMREAWDEAHDTTRAVAHGLERTGRLVTAAALIMVAAFAGFVAGRVPGLDRLGAGLALGVLVDATVVRVLLVPALMALLGRWNWWLPGRP